MSLLWMHACQRYTARVTFTYKYFTWSSHRVSTQIRETVVLSSTGKTVDFIKITEKNAKQFVYLPEYWINEEKKKPHVIGITDWIVNTTGRNDLNWLQIRFPIKHHFMYPIVLCLPWQYKSQLKATRRVPIYLVISSIVYPFHTSPIYLCFMYWLKYINMSVGRSPNIISCRLHIT